MNAPGLLLAALLCAEVAAVGLAWRAAAQKADAIAGSRKMLRVLAFVKRSPLLALLVFALVDELAVEALHVLVFAGAPRPLAGWARAGWHLETLFVLGWPAGLALAAWSAGAQKANGPRKARSWCISGGPAPAPEMLRAHRSPVNLLLGLYLGAVVALVLAYPLPRARLRGILLAWELLMVAVAWWGLYRARLRPWGAVERCLVVLVACESAVVLVGPFASDPFTRWWIARAFYLGAWGACCGVLARAPRTA